jgi:hypothetical protein
LNSLSAHNLFYVAWRMLPLWHGHEETTSMILFSAGVAGRRMRTLPCQSITHGFD